MISASTILYLRRVVIGIFAFALCNTAWPEQELQSGVSGVLEGKSFSVSLRQQFRSSRHQALNQYNGSEITTVSVNRALGGVGLHYGMTSAAQEKHHYFGLSTGRATAAFFYGNGRSFSRTGSVLYHDLNHYYFHGGNRARFEFQGGGLNFHLSRTHSLQFAVNRVKSTSAEDRTGYYAGFTAGRFTTGLFGIERGTVRAGQGFNVAYSGINNKLEYQEIRSSFGATVRRLGFSLRSRRGVSWSLNVERARNPLYSDANDNRFMVRFQRSFGPAVARNAAEQPQADSPEAGGQTSYGTVLGIGLGVGAVALAVSSGDSGSDSAQRFGSANEAAFNVLNRINPVSVRENREHGGWIYRNADGSFGSTEPVAGDVSSVNIGNPVTAVPTGTAADASYHTHGGPDPRFDNENFSPQDILSDLRVGLNGYLGTPAGFLKKHIVSTNQIVVLGRIAN